jgi:hypothetical protein
VALNTRNSISVKLRYFGRGKFYFGPIFLWLGFFFGCTKLDDNFREYILDTSLTVTKYGNMSTAATRVPNSTPTQKHRCNKKIYTFSISSTPTTTCENIFSIFLTD